MKAGSKTETTQKRRPKGEGTFEQLASGMWSCYVRRGNKKVRGEPGKDRLEASQNLQKRLVQEKKGARRASASSLTTLGRNWLKSAKLSPTTKETYGCWLNDLEADPLGVIPAKKITEDDLISWKFRAKLKWANSTVRNRCAFINQLLSIAGVDARVTRPKKEAHQRRPLSPRERQVLDELEPPTEWMALAKRLCQLTGGRRSEAFGFRHEDRDGDGIWVHRVVLLVKGKLLVRPKAKTSKSRRWVPIPAELRPLVGEGRTGFVIGGGKDPMNPKLFSDWLYRSKQDNALGNIPFFGAHALRRTYGMQLLEKGVDIITTAEILGHDPAMLADEYARSREDLKLDAVDKAFGGA